MKPIFESAKIFDAYARIDYSYFLLAQLNVEINTPKAPIVRMVEEVTGYAADKHRENRKDIIKLMKQVIKDKKLIEADTKADEIFLNKIKQLKYPPPFHTPLIKMKEKIELFFIWITPRWILRKWLERKIAKSNRQIAQGKYSTFRKVKMDGSAYTLMDFKFLRPYKIVDENGKEL